MSYFNKKKYSYYVLVLLLFFQGCVSSSEESIRSPNRAVIVHISNTGEQLKYWIEKNGQIIIQPSELGLITESWDLSNGKAGTIRQKEELKTHAPLWGSTSEFVSHYQEAVIPFRSEDGIEMQVVFRIFNEGVAFRYEIPVQRSIDSIILTDEITEFRFDEDYRCFALNNRDIEDVDLVPSRLTNTNFSLSPMLVELNNGWVALNEAAIYDMSMMYFVNPNEETAMRADIGKSKLALPAKTPWRVIQVGDSATNIVESNVVTSLNKPYDPEEFSWICPGKCLWDHRNLGDTINDFIYGKDTASMKRLVDFAARTKISYLLIDGGWYTEAGPLFPKKHLNIPGIISYAEDRDVKIILYIERRRTSDIWDLEEVLDTFREWGVAGIKYGFLSNEFGFSDNELNRQGFVKATNNIVRLCASYQMLLIFHDRVVQPGGEQYTWPNLIVQEYCHAQQDGRPTPGDRKVEPTMAVTIPFVNGLNGPQDMSNGFYDLENLHARSKTDPLGINSTVVGETARCMVYYSPVLILGDNGDEYDQKSDLFEFIQMLPDSWDETIVMEGLPGDFIIMARRKENDWFVAGITDEERRDFNISLDFLEAGDFNITLYTDTDDTHFQNQKETYEIIKTSGTADSLINVSMAPGGGFCMIIRPVNHSG